MQGTDTEGFIAAYLEPLNEVLPLWVGEGGRTSNFTGLNRHEVLHGESVGYGTAKHSLQAIALLSYVRNIWL